jgi:hypothetical protein
MLAVVWYNLPRPLTEFGSLEAHDMGLRTEVSVELSREARQGTQVRRGRS